MYNVEVAGQTFEIQTNGERFVVNGDPVTLDISMIQDGYYHVLHGTKSFRAEVVEVDRTKKRLAIKVNGRLYPVIVKDRFDVLLDKMGMNSNAGTRVNNIKAPMPGLIVALSVKDGDEVKAGDTLLVLEAMKMENVIKAPGDAVVKSVKVKMGEGVEKNQVLIEFGPV